SQEGEGEVAAQSTVDEERQLLDRLIVYDSAEIAPFRLEQRCLALHLYGFRKGAKLEAYIDARGGVHLHQDFSDFGLSKAVFLRAQVVFTGREVWESISAFRTRDHVLSETGFGIL